ncbi:MAG TPA: hypothetical protein VM223_04185 [Planctomycetota bacterium]|nr:hypothetical protein [Planctomycetota bacterium]
MSDALKHLAQDLADPDDDDGFRPGKPETAAAAAKKFKLPAYGLSSDARIVVVPERIPGETPGEYRARCQQVANDIRIAAAMSSVTVRWRTPGEHWIAVRGDAELDVVNRALAAYRRGVTHEKKGKTQ